MPVMLSFLNTAIAIILVHLALLPIAEGYTNHSDVLSYVDPLIGSQKGGNVFAGATLPYGMAKGLKSPPIYSNPPH